jgi:hypothetical protein
LAKKKKPTDPHRKAAERDLRDALERADRLLSRRAWADAFALLYDLDRTYSQRQEVLWRLAGAPRRPASGASCPISNVMPVRKRL